MGNVSEVVNRLMEPTKTVSAVEDYKKKRKMKYLADMKARNLNSNNKAVAEIDVNGGYDGQAQRPY